MSYVNGAHHITMCVGPAQEDIDFHTKTLGLRPIKRTVLFDGVQPVYHLYYSNAHGDAGAVITTFPFRQAGVMGRRGTNQAREVLLSVPTGSLDWWKTQLSSYDIEAADVDILNTRRLAFRHPSGIEYRLVEVDDDPREGWGGNGVPQEYAIHGIYGVGVHVHTPETQVEFMDAHMGTNGVTEETGRFAATIGPEHLGGVIELIPERNEDQGTWTYAEGTIHHFALNVDNLENQGEIQFEIEGAGYTDISELKDRKYFKSVYVRSPSGALFELAVTHDEGGWTCDESPEELGKSFQVPSKFEERRQEMLGRLEPVTFE